MADPEDEARSWSLPRMSMRTRSTPSRGSPRPRRASWCRCTSVSIGGTSAAASSCSPTSAPSPHRTTARRTSSARSCRRRSAAAMRAELVLIDGQQRITTLMLLVAALHHTVRTDDPRSPPSSSACSCAPMIRAAPSCARIGRGRRSSRAWSSTGAIADDERASPASTTTTPSSAARSAPTRRRNLAGLQKLEHVAISLGADANAQQIFESLNSTGEPLRDHELIHNYVLMGLSHAEQSEIEDDVLGADRAEHRRVDRQLLAALPRDDDRARGRGRRRAGRVRRVPPRVPAARPRDLRAHAAEWQEYSEIYRVLLDPRRQPDARSRASSRYVEHLRRAACIRS